MIITGKWGRLAEAEARKYGDTSVLLDGKDSDYTRVPEWDSTQVDPEASYVHITTNNTLYGTQWSEIPDTGNVPLALMILVLAGEYLFMPSLTALRWIGNRPRIDIKRTVKPDDAITAQ